MGRLRALVALTRVTIGHEAFRHAPLRTLFRMLTWPVLVARGRPVIVDMQPFQAKMKLRPRMRAGSTWPFLFRAHYDAELLALKDLLPVGGTFIDGGASIGIYTVVASSIVGPQGVVVAFEPGKDTFVQLRDNIRLNGMANVRLIQGALADTSGHRALFHNADAPNLFSLGADGAPDSEQVEVFALDTCEAVGDLERVDVIKLDIEGAEELALRGGRKLLEKHRPLVMLEVRLGMPERLSLSPYGAWEFLDRLGYRFAKAHLDGTLSTSDNRGVGNYVAVPPTSPIAATHSG
jgi:FkbM family methyltransferase